MENERTHCETCGASLKKFWHRLSPGLVSSLIKARRHVGQADKNDFHLYDDLTGENTLTTAEQMNWTKLRFHGLVAHAKKDGILIPGHWLITRRGGEFLSGTIAIPKRVQTFRNRVVAKDEERVFIGDVIKNAPHWDAREDYRFDYATEEDLMANIPTAGLRKKLKKGQQPCPICRNALVRHIDTEPGSNGNSLAVKEYFICTKCTYDSRKT